MLLVPGWHLGVQRAAYGDTKAPLHWFVQSPNHLFVDVIAIEFRCLQICLCVHFFAIRKFNCLCSSEGDSGGAAKSSRYAIANRSPSTLPRVCRRKSENYLYNIYSKTYSNAQREGGKFVYLLVLWNTWRALNYHILFKYCVSVMFIK